MHIQICVSTGRLAKTTAALPVLAFTHIAVRYVGSVAVTRAELDRTERDSVH
jgi:hypothetical protein